MTIKYDNQINCIIIYQSPKFSFSCVSLDETVSRETRETRLSPSHLRERETMRYSRVNNGKKSRARPLDRIGIVVFQIKFKVIIFEIKYFMYFPV